MSAQPAGGRPVDERTATGAQSVERALAVLSCFSSGEPLLGISELAARVGLGPSTVHRMVRALCNGGLLAQDPRTERYHLGPMTAALGRLASDRLGLDLARAELQDLAERTGEAVNLGTRRGDEVLVLLHVESPQPLRFEQAPGTRVPLHSSAMGKAILAFGEETAADAVGSLSRLDRHTRQTITDRRELIAELENVRARGFAENNEERNLGVRSVAVPVLDDRAHARAAISVQGPSVRIGDERVGEIAAAARAVAARVADLIPIQSL